MSKSAQSYRAFLNPQSEFDHRYCCWAANHSGWSKMKRLNRRIAKRRQRRADRKLLWDEQMDIREGLWETHRELTETWEELMEDQETLREPQEELMEVRSDA